MTLTGHNIEDVESAILSTLEPLKEQFGGQIKKIASYNGEIDLEEMRAHAFGNFPCILISYKGGEYLDRSYPITDHQQTWEIFIITQSLKNNRDAATKGTLGVYQLLQLVFQTLHDSGLGLESPVILVPARAASDRRILNEAGVSVYSIDFSLTSRLQ